MKKELKERLDSLKLEDIYSTILFALFKLQDVPEYATLSRLSYALNGESFLNFLELFGGLTIKVPTLREFKIVVNALLLYQYVNIEEMELNQALKLLEVQEYKVKDIKDAYFKLVEVLDKYDFTNK